MGLQLIPNTANRLDNRISITKVKFLAQNLHIRIDIVGANVRFQPPNAVKNDIPGNNNPDILGQQIKDLELPRSQLDNIVLCL